MFRSIFRQSQKLVEYKKSQDGFIGVIGLNRPESKNALSKQLLHELNTIVEDVKTDDKLRVVLFRTLIPKVFCAGADLKERLSMSETDTRNFVITLRNSFQKISEIKIPTIACIDGAALGGGLELSLACDFRTSSKDSIVGLPETSLAIIPGAGGTQRLPRLIGVQKAKLLMYTSRKLNAAEGVQFGVIDVANGVNCNSLPSVDNLEYLVDDILTNSDKEQYKGYITGLRLANEILRNGPVALKAVKQSIQDGIQLTDMESALDVERQNYDTVLKTADRIEALKAFTEKRKPEYNGK